jgi:hypothetical protein
LRGKGTGVETALFASATQLSNIKKAVTTIKLLMPFSVLRVLLAFAGQPFP